MHPDIVRSLHASSSSLQWTIDAYGVVFAGLSLVLGNLGDRLGRKWVLMAGIAVFGLGSVASAFSGSPDRLIAARAFMGIGAAAVMPATLSILTNVYVDPDERSRAVGIWSATTGLGVAVGPVLGGLLLVFLFTQYLQFSLGYSAPATGVRIAPIAAVLMVAAPLSTALDRLFGTKPVVSADMGLVTASFVLLSFTTVHAATATPSRPP